MELPIDTQATNIMVLSDDQLVNFRQAAGLAHKMGFAFTTNGVFVGVFVECFINGQLFMLKVDENFDMTVDRLYWEVESKKKK